MVTRVKKNEASFLNEWECILKNQSKLSFLFFQSKGENDDEVAIEAALKGIQYYYYGRIESALYNINYALSIISSEYIVLKTLLNYYKISIIYDSISIKLENCIFAYKSFINLNPHEYNSSLCYLFNILFHSEIPAIEIENESICDDSRKKTKKSYINKVQKALEDSLLKLESEEKTYNDYLSLFNFVKLRVLDAIASIKNDASSWDAYIDFIERTQYIVDRPRATFYHSIFKKDYSDECIKLLSKQIIETKNAQVEKKRAKICSDSDTSSLIDSLLSLENQLTNNCLLFNSVDFCYDVIWGIDSLSLCNDFLNYIKNLDRKFVYLYNGNLIPEYVDHGIGHVLSIFINLKEIHHELSVNEEDLIAFFHFEKKDYMNLIRAIILHDIGMNGNHKSDYAMGGKNLRDNHALLSWDHIINDESNTYGLKNSGKDKYCISLIASLHNGQFIDEKWCYDNNDRIDKASNLYNKWREFYSEFFETLNPSEKESFDQLVAIMQLLDGIDFKRERVGINAKLTIVKEREKLFADFLSISEHNNHKEFFKNQLDCLNGWNDHYIIHYHTEKIVFHYDTTSRSLNISIRLSVDYNDDEFKSEMNNNFYSNLNDYFKYKVNVKIV